MRSGIIHRMKTIVQPPPCPDHLEEQPPEGWRGVSSRQFWTTMVVGLVVTLLTVLVATPLVFRTRSCGGRCGDRVQAINNAKQVGLAMLEFEQEFGSFPNEKTAAEVKRRTGTALDLSGSSSNAMFRQLIAFGIQSEDIFYARHAEGSRRPDKVFTPGRALETGEVGFSYVAGLGTSMHRGIPLIMTPMKSGTQEFWPEVYKNKAVILRLDNSVVAPLIRKADQKVSAAAGKALFDQGLTTVWPAGHVIDVRHPEW